MVYPTDPSLKSCVAKQWLILLGYTLELTPVIVKVSFINSEMQNGRKSYVEKDYLRLLGAQLSRKRLFKIVGGVICFVAIYLFLWTWLDPPSLKKELVLTEFKTESGSAYINVLGKCGSSSPYWFTVALCWQGILRIGGTVLAFQSRNMLQNFNESLQLATMMYSHCVLLLLFIIVRLFSGTLSEEVLATATSFILSLDIMITLGVYFVPKIHDARKGTLPAHDCIILGVTNSYISESMADRCYHSASCTCFSNRNGVSSTTGTSQ